MSHSLTGAPPPPPPLLLTPAPINGTSRAAPTKNPISDCLWAISHPELQKACHLACVCLATPPQKCQFHEITSMLQVGPTCGLTAISMLLGGTPTPGQLLANAKQLHYTLNGEMFSAKSLFQLICDNLPESVNSASRAKECCEVQCQLHEGRLDCAKVRACLMAGACLFVPYDPDYNHSPCLKLGHKAHWALIVGYLISDNQEFHVLARHGKAKNLAVWSLKALSDSNSNLIEFAQPKGYPDCDFLLPPGGIGGDLGLRERAIIVNGLPHETTTLS